MKRVDILLLACTVFLTVFGLFMIYDATSFVAFRDFADKYHFVKDQIIWIALGFFALIVFANLDYHKFYNLALPGLIVSILLLCAVFIPGIGLRLLGANRWIDFRLFSLQPSEIIKLTLAIYLSAWFSTKEKGRVWAFLLLLSMIVFLIILEPDMGTAITVLVESVVLFFLSGAKTLYFLIITPIVALLGIAFALFEPYRAKRLMTFLNFNQDVSNSSYHVRQILIALGSGGLTGVGFGNSLQKYAYLPETATDSIFAIIAEEIGFIGTVGIIFLFLLVIVRAFKISSIAKDTFGKLLAAGIGTFLATQILINLAAQTALLPLTGIPLPLISHGGSSLIIDLSSIGILLNIYRQGKI